MDGISWNDHWTVELIWVGDVGGVLGIADHFLFSTLPRLLNAVTMVSEDPCPGRFVQGGAANLYKQALVVPLFIGHNAWYLKTE